MPATNSAQSPSVLERGHTLVETAVALLILAILMGFGIPTLGSLTQSNRMTSAQNRFVTHLSFARAEAVRRMHRVVLCPTRNHETCSPDPLWHRGWMVFVDRDRDRERGRGEPVLRIGEPMHAQLHATTPRTRRRISFFPDGRSPGSNLTLTFCDRTGTVKPEAIILSSLGRARHSEAGPGGRDLHCPGNAPGHP